MLCIKCIVLCYDLQVICGLICLTDDLLSHTADLIDKVMDTEDDLLIQWSSSEMVQAVLEAVKQCRYVYEAISVGMCMKPSVSVCV